jgi:hypothetical protein
MCPGWHGAHRRARRSKSGQKRVADNIFSIRHGQRNATAPLPRPPRPPHPKLASAFTSFAASTKQRAQTRQTKPSFTTSSRCVLQRARQGGSSQIRKGKELNQHGHVAGRQSPPHPPPVGPRGRRGAICTHFMQKVSPTGHEENSALKMVQEEIKRFGARRLRAICAEACLPHFGHATSPSARSTPPPHLASE